MTSTLSLPSGRIVILKDPVLISPLFPGVTNNIFVVGTMKVQILAILFSFAVLLPVADFLTTSNVAVIKPPMLTCLNCGWS